MKLAIHRNNKVLSGNETLPAMLRIYSQGVIKYSFGIIGEYL